MWSALYPISNHSHIRQLQFATHAFSQQVLQQAVQISICQWNIAFHTSMAHVRFHGQRSKHTRAQRNTFFFNLYLLYGQNISEILLLLIKFTFCTIRHFIKRAILIF